MRSCLLALLWSLVALGCDSEIPNTEAEGGYLEFREAILHNDQDALWNSVSEETKAVFRDAFNDLRSLSQSIRRLAPSDRTLVRERTSIFLVGVAESPRELFDTMLRISYYQGDESAAVGTEIDDIQVDESGDRATVTTRACVEFVPGSDDECLQQQTVDLVREEDGVWRVSSLTSIAQERLQPISENLLAVQVMVANSGHNRRSHEEVMRLLSGGTNVEVSEGTGSAPAVETQ